MNTDNSDKKINSENENNNEINIKVNTNENNNTDIQYNQSNEVFNLNSSKINPEPIDDEDENPPKNNIVKKSSQLKKILFITIAISIIICVIVVGIIIGLKKSKNKKKEKIKENEENEENLINYKISNLIYNSTKEEKINTTFNTIGINKYRNDVKKINSEYLFLIVSEPNEINNYFLGYIIILKRTELLNEKEKKIFDDSINLYEDNKNFKGIIQIKFNKNGTIIEQLFQKDSNEIYINEINDTISCLIPNFLNKKNIENIKEKKSIDFGINNNNKISWISNNLKGRVSFDDDPLINSKYDSKINITIQESNIIKSVLEKKLLIQNEKEENENLNFTVKSFVFFDDLNDDDFINGLIESIEINSTQILNFDKENKQKISEKFINKLNKLNFISNSSSNKLRYLSNEEYEKKLKLQNELNSNNNLRNLQNLEKIDPIEMPLGFQYDLFKINVLGIQLSLKSNINFFPTPGIINYQLYYQRGTKIFKFDEINIEIENYKNVVLSYKTFTLVIINYIKENILNWIEFSYSDLSNIMERYLNNYKNILEIVLNFLDNLFKDYFKFSLDNFKENIIKYASNGFKNLYNDLNIISILEDIEDSLNNGNEKNLKEFILKSETNLKNIIIEHKSNLTNLEESVKIFINKTIETINNLESNEKIKIDFYYKIKDIFDKIDVIMDSFNDNLSNALDSEFLLIQTYIDDDIYMNQIDNLIDDVEVVWDIFKNNDIVKEIMGFDNANAIASKLENIRKKYENVKNTFLNKVKESYENFKNTNIKNEFIEVQNMKKNLNEKEKTLIELIKSKFFYISNYEKYNDDIKKVTKIENEISTLKLNAYQNQIYNKLNEIKSETFLNSTSINNIIKEIEEEIKLLKTNLENNDEIKLTENLNNILTKFIDISSSNNIEKIINDIKNKFSFDYLKTLVSNYYTFIKENIFPKYSNLVDDIIKNSLDKYLSEPIELINKIKSLFNKIENNTEKENEKLQILVSEKMKNILNDIISKINNIITTETNYFRTNINSINLKTKINEFYTNSSNLTKNLQNKISNYLLSFNYSLNLKNIIQEEEENISLEITEIAENLRQKFYYLFCYENETLNISCPNSLINKMNENEKYYFQISKIQNTFNHLNLLEFSINNVINDENLNNFSVENFINFFKTPENFDFNIITSQIKKNLEIIKNNGIQNTKSAVNSLKEIIKMSFISYNQSFYELIIKSFFNNIIKIPKDLEENLNLLFIKVQKKGREGFLKDINYYKKKEFFYDLIKANLEEEFNKKWNKYSNLLKEKKDSILNNFTLTEDLNKKILKKFEDKIFNEINNYQNELNIFMTVRSSKNCKLLENEISLIEIANQAIIEIKNDFSSNIKIDLFKEFNFSLNKYKKDFDINFKNFENKIENQFRFFFNNYHNEMAKRSNPQSSNKISSFTDGIIKGFENGINLCLENFEKLFELNILFKDDQKINFIMDEIFNKFSFIIPNSLENVDRIIDDNLKPTCENELIREKNLFQNNFFDYLKSGLNNTIVNFMNGSGKSYLNEIFLNDYDFNIVSKIYYIKEQIKDIDEYLNIIIDNLNEIDSNLNNSISDIYNKLRNNIFYGLNYNKINDKLFNKIEQFNINFTEKIIDYFKSFTLNVLSDDSILNTFSEQVKILFPFSNVPFTFILDLRYKLKNLLDSLYFSDLKQKYLTNINHKNDEILNEIKNLQISILLKINKLSKKNENFDLSNNILEFNDLDNNLNNFVYKSNFDLTEDMKTLIENVLLNSTFKNNLIQIPIDYNNVFNNIKNEINNNVRLEFDSSNFIKNLKETIIKNDIKDEKISDFIEDRNKSFLDYLNQKSENLEKEVKNEYSQQISTFTDLNSLDDKRRLENKNVDFGINSIQEIFNSINEKISFFDKNITYLIENINLKNKMNQMNNAIYVYFLDFDNSIENYLKYSKFFLNSTNTFSNYQKNITNIYNEIGNIFKDSFSNQITKLKKFSILSDEYKIIYFNEIKPKLIENINNLLKYSSKQFISKYLKNQIDKGQKNYIFNKTTDLKNINEINAVLGSTKLNYLINVQNTLFEWGYNFTTDANNYKIYLDIYTTGLSNGSIVLSNEFYKSSIQGNFGNDTNGMNITLDFSGNEIIDYYTKHNNNTYEKTLYEITSLDSWKNCKNDDECFISENNDYCPKIIKIEDENQIIVKSKGDENFYDEKYYLFNGLYENNLCYFDNYFYSIEESYFEFNSIISKIM